MLQSFILSNGIRVVTYTMASLRSVHALVSVKGGSIVESDANNGVAHFMEHMLVQGIPSLPNVREMSSYIEGLAGKYNAYTSQLAVSFSITVPFSHTKDALRIASEVFFEPLFPEVVLEKERRAVLNEIKQDMDSRWFKFHEFFKQTRYIPGSPLLRRVGGTIEVVSSLTREDLLKYWQMYFTPANTYIFLIGNLTEVDPKSLLEEYFGRHTSKKQFPGFPDISNAHLAERKVAIRHDPELRVNYMDLVFPSLSMGDNLRDRIIQNIALIILGRLRTSRLFQLLRYDLGLVYGISANDSQWPQAGYAYVTSEVSNEHLDEVLELIVREVTSFHENGPLEKELEFTKKLSFQQLAYGI